MEIQKLTLFTSNLDAQKKFYSITLGFNICNENQSSISFQIGQSILEFQERENSTQYHFAFNIPGYKENEALLWLKSRVEILKDGEIEIQDFDFWNAKAIYFYDADNNIVEFISRKNLNNSTQEEFNVQQVLEISEIGLPTDNIKSVFDHINGKTTVPLFSGGMERFCAQGNEHGLFIIIDKKKKTWFPTNETAFSSDFELVFKESGKVYSLFYMNEDLKFLK